MKLGLYALLVVFAFGCMPDANAACSDPTSRVGPDGIALHLKASGAQHAGFVGVSGAASIEGTMIYDPALKKILLCDGSEWAVMRTEGNDGLTEATAATSCKAILLSGFSTGNGAYWIKPDAFTTAYNTYCDMGNGGWTKIMGSGTSCPVGLDAVSALTTATSCGHLPHAFVGELASISTQVQLRNGASATSYTAATSTNALAIDALISPTGTWHNGATFDAWAWSYSCTSGASGWPFMYQACGNGYAVHWGYVYSGTRAYESVGSSRVSGYSSTWLR